MREFVKILFIKGKGTQSMVDLYYLFVPVDSIWIFFLFFKSSMLPTAKFTSVLMGDLEVYKLFELTQRALSTGNISVSENNTYINVYETIPIFIYSQRVSD